MTFLLVLPFYYCFDYRRVIGAEIDEAVCYAKFPDGFKEGVRGGVPCMLSAVYVACSCETRRSHMRDLQKGELTCWLAVKAA